MPTLAQIEQATAPRCGPYRQVTVASGATASFIATSLLTSIEDGGSGIVDAWVLRRGLLIDGTPVPGYVTGDRIRMAKDYTPSTGTVMVDRNYATAPVANELIEFHHLHPTDELRAAVLAGLKRCYLVDRASVTLSGTATERNLTAQAPWITDPDQLYAVSSVPVGSTELPLPQWWNRTFTTAGAVWLALSPDPYPNTLLVTSRRPHFTLVNGVASTTGPTADSDTLSVDLHYAASAAHVEAWRIAQDKLQDAANEGRRLNLVAAAAVFTAAAKAHFSPPRPSWGFDEPYGGGRYRTSLW